MENSKIKNATSIIYDNIHFRSLIEKRVYMKLKEFGINPNYEKDTYELSARVRPCNTPFYVRSKSKGFHLEMSPIHAITYTPDFTFTYNDIHVIIEVKGYANDVYPVKKNLFRKLLENTDSMYFEIKSLKELDAAISIVKSETPVISKIRKCIAKMEQKDLIPCYKYLEKRDFTALKILVISSIKKIEKSYDKDPGGVNLSNLYILKSVLDTL